MLELRKRNDKWLLMWEELQLCHPLTADELILLRQQIDWALASVNAIREPEPEPLRH